MVPVPLFLLATRRRVVPVLSSVVRDPDAKSGPCSPCFFGNPDAKRALLSARFGEF